MVQFNQIRIRGASPGQESYHQAKKRPRQGRPRRILLVAWCVVAQMLYATEISSISRSFIRNGVAIKSDRNGVMFNQESGPAGTFMTPRNST